MRAWRISWSDTAQSTVVSAWVMQPAARSVPSEVHDGQHADQPRARHYRIVKQRHSRYWEVRDPRDELVCITVYKKGAAEVVRRLAA